MVQIWFAWKAQSFPPTVSGIGRRVCFSRCLIYILTANIYLMIVSVEEASHFGSVYFQFPIVSNKWKAEVWCAAVSKAPIHTALCPPDWVPDSHFTLSLTLSNTLNQVLQFLGIIFWANDRSACIWAFLAFSTSFPSFGKTFIYCWDFFLPTAARMFTPWMIGLMRKSLVHHISCILFPEVVQICRVLHINANVTFVV